ncbi:TonB-dependent receptor domain-containing protein [Roseateles cellulosilyticus]|uniref:TonB-dependent receptor n=1 Tax=Pelomonas cellulosilytica TaxID=2906762 RepID=A0ABS8XSU6_9BURK|nr:TonB-dependent receptor [Pelomonas sp. P8]MCE4553686.1 TonB-dependent receptor [Pelomonas sp. P8]
MLKRHAVSAAAALTCITAAMQPAFAQQQLERVEITGSSIKRIASEGSVPIQTFSAEQIKSTGATNVAELLQRIPAMQGFSIADTAIGSNSGGTAFASLHDIGQAYTLVLLNGRRLAPTGDGGRVNLSSIPMSAIDRIEVLTDGASALYGSDAIAGVINFVLKRNKQGGEITASYSNPLEGGGKSAYASITYGFGDLERDRFNVVATYRHDDQQRLKSGDRDFAKTAYVPVSYQGKDYVYDRTSTSADPANAQVTFKKIGTDTKPLSAYSFNPYLMSNGSCAPNNFYNLANTIPLADVKTNKAGTAQCAFDFVSTIDIYPEYKRDAAFVSSQFKVNDSVKLFSDLAYTRYDLTARIAPNPVPIDIPVGSALYNKYVSPYLTAEQQARVDTVTAAFRATDFGTRNSETITQAKHVVVGAEADIGSWNINGALTWSQNALDEQYVGGYFKKTEFTNIVSALAIDPFVPSGNQTAAAQQLISDSIYHGSIRTASTTLKGGDVRASGELFDLPAGPVNLGVGLDVRNYHYKQTPSNDAVNGVIYNFAANPKYDLERDNYGVFAELLVPVAKNVELNASLRRDSISKIKDAVNGRDFGTTAKATTYKLSGKYTISSQIMVRGSYGTGFKAPDMLDIAQPLVSNGVTASQYDCPFPGDGSGSPPCKPGKAQYSQLSGGNENLKPEKSKQATLGFRVEPTANFSAQFDYWQVKLRDAVSGVSANQAFGDPQKYANLFSLYRQPAEKNDFYAFMALSTNIGQQITKGIDWEFEGRVNIPDVGRLTTSVNGTYMIKSSYTRPGTSDDFTDSMGHYGENAAVTFRNIFGTQFKLQSGNFTNSLFIKYRSKYKDRNQTVRDLSTGKNTTIALDVPEYITLDYQGTYRWSKALELRLGINNLLNSAPPLTLRDSSGHQVAYDPRYASPMMRTVYVTGSYSF